MNQITREQMLQVFKNRCSTRYYDPNKKISQEDFAAILEFARLSPSSVGSEPWKFLVIQNKALREKIKPFSWGMQSQLDDCSHLVIILAKKNARYDTPFFRSVAERRGLQGESWKKRWQDTKASKKPTLKLPTTNAHSLTGAASRPILLWPICSQAQRPSASIPAQSKASTTTK